MKTSAELTVAARKQNPNGTGTAHTLGAALQGLLGASAAAARLGVAAAYWLLKERKDLTRGGGWRDGLVDAALVGVGAFYTGPRWWPVAVFVTISVGAAIKEMKTR